MLFDKLPFFLNYCDKDSFPHVSESEPAGKISRGQTWKQACFQFGTIERGSVTPTCLKYYFSSSLLLPKGLCSLCSGGGKVGFEVPFSQKDELIFNIASLGLQLFFV